MDIYAVEVIFPSWPGKWRHLNFAFTHSEHHSPPKWLCWTQVKLWFQRQNPEIAERPAFCRAGICTSKLIRWVCSLSGNCSNTRSQGRFYPTPFVSDVCLSMFKHFLLYLENSRSWLGTKNFTPPYDSYLQSFYVSLHFQPKITFLYIPLNAQIFHQLKLLTQVIPGKMGFHPWWEAVLHIHVQKAAYSCPSESILFNFYRKAGLLHTATHKGNNSLCKCCGMELQGSCNGFSLVMWLLDGGRGEPKQCICPYEWPAPTHGFDNRKIGSVVLHLQAWHWVGNSKMWNMKCLGLAMHGIL